MSNKYNSLQNLSKKQVWSHEQNILPYVYHSHDYTSQDHTLLLQNIQDINFSVDISISIAYGS